MRSLSSLLRSAPSRLRRRLVLIAEIAAASLPAAGA
jgi:hypothetical protein